MRDCMICSARALVLIALVLAVSAQSDVVDKHKPPRRVLAAEPSRPPSGPGWKQDSFVLYHKPRRGSSNSSSAPIPITFTVHYPSNAPAAPHASPGTQQQRLPLLFLLNGANVEAEHYSTLATLLGQRGYAFVASNYYQPLPPEIQASLKSAPTLNWTRPSTCPSDKILSPTAALLPLFLNHAKASNSSALRDLASRGVVLVTHSQGAAVAMAILGGTCLTTQRDGRTPTASFPDYCEGYQPPLPTYKPSSSGSGSSGSSGSGSNTSSGSSNASSSCAGVQSSPQQQGTVLGVVAYEGYKSRPATPAEAAASGAAAYNVTSGNTTSSFVPTGIAIPPGTFLLYLSGEFAAAKLQQAYQSSNTSSCACGGLATFAGLNHYGLNDWQGSSGTSSGRRQITPCGRPAGSDPVSFNITSSFQNRQLQAEAGMIDDFIRASVLRDGKAAQALRQQALKSGNQGSSESQGYKLQLKQQCFL